MLITIQHFIGIEHQFIGSKIGGITFLKDIYGLVSGVKFWFGLACCFTSQSTAMVMLGQSVHLTTRQPLNESAEGRSMTVEIIS